LVRRTNRPEGATEAVPPHAILRLR
jgi:hypothetical protein